MSDPQDQPGTPVTTIEATGQVIEGGPGGDPGGGGGGDPPRKSYKPTKLERESRILEIYRLLVIGLSRADIHRFVAEKTTWSVNSRTIDTYTQKATELFTVLAAYRREIELGKAIARCTDLFSRSHRIQDYKTALAAQKELNELLGLYATTDGQDDERGGFVALIPAQAENDEDWEAYCQRDQEQRQLTLQAPPKVVGTNAAGA
jgi:hypothetical protein